MTDIIHKTSSLVRRSGPLKRRKSHSPDGFVLLTEDEPLEQEKKENKNLTEYREAPSSPSASDGTNDLSPFDNPGSPGSPPPFSQIDNERLPNELLDEICSDVGFKDTMDLDIVEFLMDQEVPTTDAGQHCDLFSTGGLFSVGCLATPSKNNPKGSGERAASPSQALPPTGYSACSSTSGSPVSKRFHAAPLSSQSSPQKDVLNTNSFKLPKTPSKTCAPTEVSNAVQSPCRPQIKTENLTTSTATSVSQSASQSTITSQSLSDSQYNCTSSTPHSTHTSNSTGRCCSPSSGAPPPLHHLGPRPPMQNNPNPQNVQGSMRPPSQRMPQSYNPSQMPPSPRSGFKKIGRPSPPVVNVLNMPQSQNMPHSPTQRWMGNNNNGQGSMPQHQYSEINHQKFDQGKVGFYNNPNAASQYLNQQGRTLDSPLDQGYFSGDTASVRSFSSSSSSTGTTVMCGGLPAGKGHMMRRGLGANPAMNPYMQQQQPQQQEVNVYRAAQSQMGNNGTYPSQQQQQFGNDCGFFGKSVETNDQGYNGQMNPQVNRPYPSPGLNSTNCYENSFNPVGNFETDFNDNEQKSVSTKILPRCTPYIKSDIAPYTVPCNNGQTVPNPYDIQNNPNGTMPAHPGPGGHNMEIAANTNYDNCRQMPDMQNSNMTMMPSMEGPSMHIPQSMPSPARGYNMNANMNTNSMQMPTQQNQGCDSMPYGNRTMQQGSAIDQTSFVGQMPNNLQMSSNNCGGIGVQPNNMATASHSQHQNMPAMCPNGQPQYGVQTNAMGVQNNAMGVQNNTMGVQNNAMGVQNNPMGVQNNAMGVQNNPMGSSANQSWQQGGNMTPQQMNPGYGKPPMCNQGMPQTLNQSNNGAGHICGPNCNCKNSARRPPVISSQQSFIQHLITDRSNAFRSHPLFPLLRDLIIADMNFNSPSFPYQLIRNLPADFDKLLQNFLQRNPPNGSYQNNYAVESVIMDALKYAHQCLIEKIKVRQEQDKHTKTTSKSLSAIEEFCEKFDRAVRNSMSKPEHPTPGNPGEMGVPMMNGGQPGGVMPMGGPPGGMVPQDHKHMEMPPPSGYLSSPMKKLDHMGGFHFQGLRDLPDSASESGSSISSTSCHNKTESKKHPSLPKEAVAMMLDWLRNHKDNPYPNDDEKAMLIKQTGLTINQINYWFTNARRRILPKWAQAKS